MDTPFREDVQALDVLKLSSDYEANGDEERSMGYDDGRGLAVRGKAWAPSQLGAPCSERKGLRKVGE